MPTGKLEARQVRPIDAKYARVNQIHDFRRSKKLPSLLLLNRSLLCGTDHFVSQ
jgi:hypothetical protein